MIDDDEADGLYVELLSTIREMPGMAHWRRVSSTQFDSAATSN